MSKAYQLPHIQNPQPESSNKAVQILQQSRTQTLVGSMVMSTRKGARRIERVFLESGQPKVQGKPINLTFDLIAAIHWQAA